MNRNTTRISLRSTVRLLTVFLAVALISGCALQPPPFTGGQGLPLNPYRIVVNFSTSDACVIDSVVEVPTSCVGAGTFCVGRSDFVWWESNPANVRYEIFFDPIFGARLRASKRGFILRPIDRQAPIADYKYSIVREGCEPNQAFTFDPRMRVDH